MPHPALRLARSDVEDYDDTLFASTVDRFCPGLSHYATDPPDFGLRGFSASASHALLTGLMCGGLPLAVEGIEQEEEPTWEYVTSTTVC